MATNIATTGTIMVYLSRDLDVWSKCHHIIMRTYHTKERRRVHSSPVQLVGVGFLGGLTNEESQTFLKGNFKNQVENSQRIQ